MIALLLPMPAKDIPAWLVSITADYVVSRMEAGESAVEAHAVVEKSFAQLFPNGKPRGSIWFTTSLPSTRSSATSGSDPKSMPMSASGGSGTLRSSSPTSAGDTAEMQCLWPSRRRNRPAPLSWG